MESFYRAYFPLLLMSLANCTSSDNGHLDMLQDAYRYQALEENSVQMLTKQEKQEKLWNDLTAAYPANRPFNQDTVARICLTTARLNQLWLSDSASFQSGDSKKSSLITHFRIAYTNQPKRYVDSLTNLHKNGPYYYNSGFNYDNYLALDEEVARSRTAQAYNKLKSVRIEITDIGATPAWYRALQWDLSLKEKYNAVYLNKSPALKYSHETSYNASRNFDHHQLRWLYFDLKRYQPAADGQVITDAMYRTLAFNRFSIEVRTQFSKEETLRLLDQLVNYDWLQALSAL